MIRGELSETYGAAAQGIDPAERARDTAFNLSMGGDPTQAGLMDNARSAQEKTNLKARNDKQKHDEQNRLAQELAAINRHLGGLYKIRDEINKDIRETKGRIGVLDDAIERLQNGKAPERDEDGSLSDKKQEKALREYEKRTGQSVDRDDPAALLAAMRAQRAHEIGVLDGHFKREKDNDAEIGKWEDKRDRAEAKLDQSQRSVGIAPLKREAVFDDTINTDSTVITLSADDAALDMLMGASSIAQDKISPVSSHEPISAASMLDGATNIGDGTSLKDQFDPAAAGVSAAQPSQEIAQAPSPEAPDHNSGGMDNGL